MRTGLEKYYGVRIQGNRPGSQPVITILTGGELERLIVKPWAQTQTVVLDAGQFEPNTYAIEIKRYPGVPMINENVRQLWARIITPDLSRRFLNQAAIDRYKASPAPTTENAVSGEEGSNDKSPGWAARRWEYLRDHNVWSKVLAAVLAAGILSLVAFCWKQLNQPEGRNQPNSTSTPPPRATTHRSEGGAGQIIGGNTVRAIVLPDGTVYRSRVRAPLNSTVRIAKRLSNSGPGAMPVTVTATMPSSPADAITVSVEDASDHAPPGSDRHTDSVTVTGPGAQTICATAVKGSGRLENIERGMLKKLPDSLFGTGVDVGLIDVGPDATRMVAFEVSITAVDAGSSC